EVALDFDDAVHGVTLPLSLRAPGVCDTCHGDGAKPGTVPRTCPVCHGAGATNRNQGAFSFSEPCRNCQGVGTVVDEK
ncbi:molecular chaperone DnaJ, partial [Escherichia coli]|nr:molecular chaperone DnaJ [Escherichia coli]